MKYKLVYNKNRIVVVLKGNKKIIDVLGINKLLFNNNKIQYIFINKKKLNNWLLKGVEISARVARICNIYSIVNVRN